MESHGAGGSLAYQIRSDVGQMCLKRTNEISLLAIDERKKSASADYSAMDGFNADRDNN